MNKWEKGCVWGWKPQKIAFVIAININILYFTDLGPADLLNTIFTCDCNIWLHACNVIK